VEFVPVAMQPGKPQGLGTWQGTPVITLPGNPVSAFVSFEAFVRPVLRRLAGHADEHRPTAVLRAVEGWRSPPGREQHMPVRTVDGGVVPATGRGSGSHLVASLALADGLAVVPADVTEVVAGDEVTVVLLP
jgi:molybdopterin molybdotransferase